jgi:hypothetical protein
VCKRRWHTAVANKLDVAVGCFNAQAVVADARLCGALVIVFASRGHFAKRPKTLIRWPLFPLLMCLE